ncbi:MAG: zinc-dependent metalloprotease family protein [Blastocatellia bacterium]
MFIYNTHIVFFLGFALLLAVVVTAPAPVGLAQQAEAQRFWRVMQPEALPGNPPLAQSARALQLDRAALLERLAQVPLEGAASAGEVVLPVPLPDGRFVNFQLAESSVLPASLAAKYPLLKSYRGTSNELPGALMRCDWSPRGLHATILWQGQWISLHPVSYDHPDFYVSDYGNEVMGEASNLRCLVEESNYPRATSEAAVDGVAFGPIRRTFRLALATTVQYTNHAALGGGSVATTMATLNTWVNALNVIYEKDLSIRFILAENNDQLIFTSEPDGLTETDLLKMVDEIRPLMESKLGLARYDLGQLLGVGNAGLTYLNEVCANNNYKGGGVSLVSTTQPVGTGSSLILLAHEIGHQFNARHTFNDTLSPNY